MGKVKFLKGDSVKVLVEPFTGCTGVVLAVYTHECSVDVDGNTCNFKKEDIDKGIMNYLYYAPEFEDLTVMGKNYGATMLFPAEFFMVYTGENMTKRKTKLYYIGKDYFGFTNG